MWGYGFVEDGWSVVMVGYGFVGLWSWVCGFMEVVSVVLWVCEGWLECGGGWFWICGGGECGFVEDGWSVVVVGCGFVEAVSMGLWVCFR